MQLIALDDLIFSCSNPGDARDCKQSLSRTALICLHKFKLGGAYRDRTDDLLNANQALSQLS